MIGGERPTLAAQQAAGVGGLDLPQTVGPLLETRHRGHRMNLCPSSFGQTEIILHERVLGAVAATRHAGAALDAACAGRSDAAEVRVGHGLARRLGAVRPEEDADGGRHERVADTHVVGDLLHDLVGVGERRVLHHAEHALRLLVVRQQLGAPVGDVLPLRVVEERVLRHVERVGVVQRSAADAGACQDHHVAEQVDALNPVQAELRHPQELAQVPRGLRELVIGVAGAGLQDTDAVALLGQPQRGNTAPEPRTDDQNVIVRLHRIIMNLPVGSQKSGSAARPSCRRPGRPSETPSDRSSRPWPSIGAARPPGSTSRTGHRTGR